ncbi:ATP-binding protein [Luteimonas sp. e5]
MSRMRRAVIALLAAVLMPGQAGAQTSQVPEAPQLRVLGPRDGVPSTMLTGIELDRDGFVWLASDDGLARYDGNRFRTWRHVPGDPRSLPGNIVQALHVDARDRVWAASEFGGVGMLDATREGFAVMRRETHPQLASNDVFAIASQGDTLWLGTANAGLYRVAVQHDDPRTWVPEAIPGLPSQAVFALEVDAAGRLWIGTMRGLALLEDGVIRSVEIPGQEAPGHVLTLMSDAGRLWVAATDGVWRREVDGRWVRPSWSDMFERPNAVVSMARDVDGALWMGSQRRLWRVQGDDAIPQPVATGDKTPLRFHPALCVQPDGAIWAGVPAVGLGYLRSDWRGIAELRRGPEQLGGEYYRATTPALAGGIWAAGLGGHIERIDRNGVVEVMSEAVRQALFNLSPYSALEDRLGQLWLGSLRDGLVRIQASGRIDRWNRDSAVDAPPGGGGVGLLTRGEGDTLWLSMAGAGLQQRDIVTGRVLREILVDSADSGLDDGDTETIRLGPDGRLWVAGTLGLGWVDPIQPRVITPPELRGDRVFGFDFDGDDVLWLHRLSGLEQYRLDGGRWRRVARVPSGRDLPAVEAGGLHVDAAHRVWVSTQRGLFRWDPVRRHLRSYGIADGLSGQEFINQSMSLNEAGMLALAHHAVGVVLIDTRYPDPPARTATLRLDNVDVRREGDWTPVALARDALQFSADEKEFRFGGHLLAFDDPAAVRYWSLLEGLDRTWVDQGTQGERVFAGLPPGRYRLRMRARDPAGNAAAEQVLAFRIDPPWWRAPWALLMFTVLGVLLGMLLAREWRQRERGRREWLLAEQQRRMAEQASEAKTRFLATLGHEIRTPMTGVLGMAELLQATTLDARQYDQVNAIVRAGRHLLRLVNDTLDLARIESGKLTLADEPFDFLRLLQQVVALLRPLADRKGLAFNLEIDPRTPPWLWGDRTRVEQILLNLLGNAIKFTDAGEVGLQVAPLPGGHGVSCVVHDTGPGLNAEQRQRVFRRFEQGGDATTQAGGSGLGLAISQELAAMMGGRIRVDTAVGQGSHFVLELPLAQAPAGAEPTLEDGVRDTGPWCVLLVEDDATVAEVIAGLLAAQGHQVRHVTHALAALAEAAAGEFDLALLDLDLPGMDGFELARQLRHAGFTQPLVAVTARADGEAESLARASGFDAFLRKPLTSRMLSDTLVEVMAPATT